MAYMRDVNGVRLDALPVAPARRNTLVIWGDSITANNGPTISGVTNAMQSTGYWSWASVLLGQRLRLVKNAGVGSETSAQILARFGTDVAPFAPGYVLILAGRNDGAIGSAATVANLQAMIDKVRSIGAVPILCTLIPGNTLAAGQRQADNQTNQWIKRQRGQAGVIVVDWAPPLQDVNGNMRTPTVSADGTHPITLGAKRMGAVLAATLDPLVPKFDPLPSNNDDAASVTVNPLMFGTAGGLSGGATGTVATSWFVGPSTGTHTIVASKVPRTDTLVGTDWQQMTVSALGASGFPQLYQFSVAPQASWAANDGQQYVAVAEFQMDTLSTPRTGLWLQAACMDTGFATLSASRDLRIMDGNYPLENQPTSGVLRTPPFTIPTNTARIQLAVTLEAVGTVRIGRCQIRRMTSSTDPL